MKNKIIVFSLIFLVFVTACTKKSDIYIDNGVEQIKVRAEIADTEDKKIKGLMFRKSLKEDAGMWFPFGTDSTYSFWMKNTLIPLDIIFINKEFTIVDIIQAEPCEEEPCESYSTTQYSRYILEVNQGFAARNNIEIGNTVTIE